MKKLLVLASFVIISCQKEEMPCLDKGPISNCVAEDFVGEWELLDFVDFILEDACLSSMEKKSGDGARTRTIELYEVAENQILINSSIYLVKDCQAHHVGNASGLPDQFSIDNLSSTKVFLKTEDILEIHSHFILGTTKTVYRKKKYPRFLKFATTLFAV